MHMKTSSAKWRPFCPGGDGLTHWGRVTHICVGNLTIIGSDNGLSPGRRQAIIWTNAVILSIGPLGTNFSEILIKMIAFSFKKMRSKVSSGKRRPSCLGLNVLKGPKGGVAYWCVVYQCGWQRCVIFNGLWFHKAILLINQICTFPVVSTMKHLGMHEMIHILQTTFSNDFSWMKKKFLIKFDWIVSQRIWLKICQHWLR